MTRTSFRPAIATLLASNPNIKDPEIMAALGCSQRTVTRAASALRKAADADYTVVRARSQAILTAAGAFTFDELAANAKHCAISTWLRDAEDNHRLTQSAAVATFVEAVLAWYGLSNITTEIEPFAPRSRRVELYWVPCCYEYNSECDEATCETFSPPTMLPVCPQPGDRVCGIDVSGYPDSTDLTHDELLAALPQALASDVIDIATERPNAADAFDALLAAGRSFRLDGTINVEHPDSEQFPF